MSSTTATRPVHRLPARDVVVRQRQRQREAARPRLTARGRLLVLLALVLLLLGAFAAGRSASSQATSNPAPAPALTQVTVQPGDTLWAVARRTAPARDPREIVAQIRRLNDLPSAALQPGQQLLLPAVV